MIVYKVTTPSNKVYIGITKWSLERRKKEHFTASKNKNLPIHRAIRKYGNLLSWEVVDRAQTWEELCAKEREYIILYDSLKKGLNCTKGGEGGPGAKSGALNPMFGKISPNRGKIFPDEVIQKLRDSWTAEKRLSLSKKKGGKPFRVFKVMKIPAKRSPKYTPAQWVDLEEVGVWTNQNECSRVLGLSTCNLNKCLKGENYTTKGYRFEYV